MAHPVGDGQNGGKISVFQLYGIFFDDFGQGRSGVDGAPSLYTWTFCSRGCGAASKTQSVDFADYGIPTNSAKGTGNLTCG